MHCAYSSQDDAWDLRAGTQALPAADENSSFVLGKGRAFFHCQVASTKLLQARITTADLAYRAARGEFSRAVGAGDEARIQAASERVSSALHKLAEAELKYLAALMDQEEDVNSGERPRARSATPPSR